MLFIKPKFHGSSRALQVGCLPTHFSQMVVTSYPLLVWTIPNQTCKEAKHALPPPNVGHITNQTWRWVNVRTQHQLGFNHNQTHWKRHKITRELGKPPPTPNELPIVDETLSCVERETTNLWCWREWGTLHFDHNRKLWSCILSRYD